MSSKNVPLYIPKQLSTQIDQAAKLLGLPQSQCMRLSIQFGLPELLRRLKSGSGRNIRKLPRQAASAWPRKAFANINLDQPSVEPGDLDETIF